MKTALVNGRVLTPDGWREDAAVLVDDGLIVALAPAGDGRIVAAEHHDLGGHHLLPGFIDCQVNGGGGVLFNAVPTVAGLRTLAAAHRRYGTTGLMPTLISADAQLMRRAVAAVDAAMAESIPGVLGIHLEGPYLAAARKGIHDARHLRHPDATELALVTSLKRGPTLLTLAPETVPPDTLDALAAAGVILSAGHTAADYATVRRALDHGLRGFTHLFNAMAPLASREPGAVGAALEDRASWCGVIVDGHHVHPATLKVALVAKPQGKLFLVTDAMPPVGTQDQSFALDGHTIAVRDGVCRNAEGVLAGSMLTMIGAVQNCVRLLGLPLAEAARMAATYPADFLGLGASHGRIAPGCRADFTLIDDSLTVRETWVGGRCEPA